MLSLTVDVKIHCWETDVQEIEVMVKGPKVKKWEHRAIVVISFQLLVLVNGAVKIPCLVAPGVLLPLSFLVSFVPVAKLGVQHHNHTLFHFPFFLILNVHGEDSNEVL